MTVPWQHLLKLCESRKPERNRPRLDSDRRWDNGGARHKPGTERERRYNHRYACSPGAFMVNLAYSSPHNSEL